MEYSALIFDDCMDETDSYENLEASVQVFQKDDRCRQIVVSCSTDWLLKLAQRPSPKMMMVQMADTPYIALLNGLKAVSQENVVVVGLSHIVDEQKLDTMLCELGQYPAIYYNEDLQAFDTRLLMFSLQLAIETNVQIDSYAMAVEKLSNTPLQKI
ncbi:MULTISPECIES: hypothetical protein [Faecalicoccus]|uniref:hypothetical protein n=1 Tax=Faecalicoccus TaxID=1573536 RepID=UPI00142F5674|nr:hypothetical protein [Faecalicoccus pleomorphus]MBM6808653.1 hypothetical protein [Faecalicoccus pleomorphus]MDB7986831.1 hypothetical protein [Faecalicoccus pleomorphus]MDB7991867.1 hypothetical protein [Faecalicoccus pleomorphus]MDM8292213.1 hypothetical protein [Faecalicoccus pleomorphus]NJE40018.1 hypothetical protein [Faecalicoccus pleomorphus]